MRGRALCKWALGAWLLVALTFATGESEAAKRLTIAADPALYPGFSPRVTDYVVRCTPGDSIRLSVKAPRRTRVAVDGRTPRRGSFTARVKVGAGEGFRILVKRGRRRSRHWVRCLPADFPRWKSGRRGRPQAQWYVIAPTISFTKTSRYVTVFDTNGVPVWWYDAGAPALDALLVRRNHLVWAQPAGPPVAAGVSFGRYEERRLDGTLVRTHSLPGGVGTERHEFQRLPNGNLVLVSYVPRDGVDLRPYGGPESATVLDALVQEVTPRGRVAWSWNSKDHVALAETGRWWGAVLTPHDWPDGRKVYDIVHVNAVERYGRRNMLVSLRHTDSVYAVRRSTGAVVWKLGGTRTSRSLEVVGDTVDETLGGQHDIRRLRDGSLTLFDNGSGYKRGPRALRLKVSGSRMRARVVEDVRDRRTKSSFCCGSARKLPGGNWVVSWGDARYITEMRPSGRRVFSLQFGAGLFSYRAVPVLPGRLGRGALRAGMDAMHPRSRR